MNESRWKAKDEALLAFIANGGATSESVRDHFNVSHHTARDLIRRLRDMGHVACVKIGKMPKWFVMDQIEQARKDAAAHKLEMRRAKMRKDNERFREMKKREGLMSGEVPKRIIRTEWPAPKRIGVRSVFELA